MAAIVFDSLVTWRWYQRMKSGQRIMGIRTQDPKLANPSVRPLYHHLPIHKLFVICNPKPPNPCMILTIISNEWEGMPVCCQKREHTANSVYSIIETNGAFQKQWRINLGNLKLCSEIHAGKLMEPVYWLPD